MPCTQHKPEQTNRQENRLNARREETLLWRTRCGTVQEESPNYCFFGNGKDNAEYRSNNHGCVDGTDLSAIEAIHDAENNANAAELHV